MEIVISLGILAIGITLSSVIIATSLRNVNGSKNRIIAINIAREGVEAVRNIRDTNWLKYSSKKRECWNFTPPRDPAAGCSDSTDPIEPGEYIVYKQGSHDGVAPETFRWLLLPVSETDPAIVTEVPYPIPDPSTAGTTYLDARDLYLVDIDPGYDTDNDGVVDNDQDAYNHIYTDDEAPFDDDALGREAAQKTVFKRLITIKYIANDGSLITLPAAMDSAHNRMRVTAEVIWQEGPRQFSTQLSTHITDYLGRQRLEL